jgi:hypothetical protein
MNKETIRSYTILFQYLLLLKEPTYIFLIQIFQHISPITWWEDFIAPVLQREEKENFKYLDMADLLNVLKLNWNRIFKYRDKKYYHGKYDNEYKLVNKVHWIRTVVAHANEVDMSPFVLVSSLSALLDYSRLIKANESLVQKLELDWLKYQHALPEKSLKNQKEDELKTKILSVIENKVLLKAMNSEMLSNEYKLSIDRTTLRFHSMRTIDEVIGFFNGAMLSERGREVQEELSKLGLLSFADIKDEVNELYIRAMKN